MYCKHCGKEYVTDVAVICVGCGAPKGQGSNFCRNCGNAINSNQAICMNCGVPVNNIPANAEQKSKLVDGLLGIFLGSLEIHNFYLGYTTKGLIQILASTIGGFLTCFISTGGIWVWAFVEAILILTGSIDKDANGVPLKE